MREVNCNLRGDRRYGAFLDALRASLEAQGDLVGPGDAGLVEYALAQLGEPMGLRMPPRSARGRGRPRNPTTV